MVQTRSTLLAGGDQEGVSSKPGGEPRSRPTCRKLMFAAHRRTLVGYQIPLLVACCSQDASGATTRAAFTHPDGADGERQPQPRGSVKRNYFFLGCLPLLGAGDYRTFRYFRIAMRSPWPPRRKTPRARSRTHMDQKAYERMNPAGGSLVIPGFRSATFGNGDISPCGRLRGVGDFVRLLGIPIC
jgi:hypothetical protein